MITYERLWARMEKDGVSQYKLRNNGISNSTLYRLKHDQVINTDTIDKICNILGCNVEDIMEHRSDAD